MVFFVWINIIHMTSQHLDLGQEEKILLKIQQKTAARL